MIFFNNFKCIFVKKNKPRHPELVSESLNMKQFPKHLIAASNLDAASINQLFLKAGDLEQCYHKKEQLSDLKGCLVALVFFENSTRTRLSFELAVKRLGGEVIVFTASTSSLSKGESLADTIRTIDAMLIDIYVVRNQYAGVPSFIANMINGSVINAGDGKHEHPTQALLDCYTL